MLCPLLQARESRGPKILRPLWRVSGIVSSEPYPHHTAGEFVGFAILAARRHHADF